MAASLLIVFREVLEAALVIGIVLAASRGIAGRGRWIGGGLLAGILGAVLVALFAQQIATAAAGMGQEIFNAGVLFAAVAMLGWHNVWMSRHGREMAAQMNAVGAEVRAGEKPLYALAIVVALAVLREGAETVLFLYGVAASGGAAAPMLTGGLLGLAAGVLTGLALYFGLLRIPARHLFAVTSALILFLAAGMAAQAAAYLVQADLLPPLGQSLWDSSAILPEDGALGQVLHILVGYTAAPDGIQVIAWLATFVLIAALMRVAAARPDGQGNRAAVGSVRG